MGKSIALAATAVLLVAVALVAATSERVMTRAMTRTEAEAIHFARLWAAGSAQHVQRDAATGAATQWKCCRPCAQNTVPILHEAFEGDKDSQPEMKAPPPAPAEKKDDAKSFVELDSHGRSHGGSGSSSGSGSGSHVSRRKAQKVGASALTAEQKSEFQAAQQRKHRAQQDALHGTVTDATAYSCCNQCPDLMYPFPGTWNRENAYQYKPKRRFRFEQVKKQPVLAEVDATTSASASASALARAKAAAGAATGSESASEYVWTNPHDLPIYSYFDSLRKAGPPRSRVQRDGKWDQPIRPGAAPLWHPPPPPHDDIYRISRSPNLHDGFDLKTPPFLPPCCDYCMSTYFPHIINDELQLPKHEPYTISPFSAVEVGATTAAAKAAGNNDAISSAEAFAKTLPSAKSDPQKCCHKCVRKDIEDTDWQIYALPPKKSKKPWRRH